MKSWTSWVLVSLTMLLCSCQHLSRSEVVAQINWPKADEVLASQRQRLVSEPPHASEDLQRYVQRVGQYVTLHLELQGPNLSCDAHRERQWPKSGFRFVVVQSDRTDVSVFPDGTLWISSQQLRGLKSEDALAGWIAHAATHVICGAGQWSKSKGELNFSPAELAVADRGASLALYRAGYWLPEYSASLLQAGYAEREKRVQRDWLKIQAQRQIQNTSELRAARFSDVLKQL
ncbi:MAG TPA: hypothetical protein PLZ57_08360 [Pseudobdellovibrionaceae bacterium]|nr:hypothetical protein [Pseudobdellovibrionaceae bacterium]